MAVLTDHRAGELPVETWVRMVVASALIVQRDGLGLDGPSYQDVKSRLESGALPWQVALETPLVVVVAPGVAGVHEQVVRSLFPQRASGYRRLVGVAVDSGIDYGARPVKVLLAF